MEKIFFSFLFVFLSVGNIFSQSVGLPNQPPTPTGPVLVCQGGIDPYSTNPTAKCDMYYWTLTPAAAGTIINDGNIAISINWNVAYSGIATLAVRGWNAHSGYGAYSPSLSITLNPKTTIVTQPASLEICEGTTATFSVVASGLNLTYQWYRNGAIIAGATGASYAINNVQLTDAANFKVIVTGVCQTATSSDATLMVKESTKISSHPVGSTICAGQTISLSGAATGSGVITYQWKKSAINIVGATSPAYTKVNALVTDAGNYTLVATGSCGSATSNAASVTVNALPTVTFGALASACTLDADFSLTTGAPVGGVYSGTGVTAPDVFSPSSLPAGVYTLTYTYTDVNSCTSSANANQVVNQSPSQPLITAGGSLALCSGQTVSLSSTAGTSYVWSNGSTTNPVTINTAGNYTVQVRNASGCMSVASSPVTVTVNPLPVVYNLSSSNTYYCSGTSGVTLTLNGSELGVNYLLYRTGVLVGLLAGTGNSLSWNNMTAGTYTAVAENGTTFCTRNMTGSPVITVRANPVLSTNGDKTICQGSSVSLVVSGANAYSWLPVTGLNSSSVASPTASPTATTTYTIVGTDAFGCQGSINQKVTVNLNPVANAGSDVDICSGSSQALLASGGTSYVWSDGTVFASTTVSPGSTTTYTVTVSNANGCSATDDIVVTVKPTPAANAGSDVSICLTKSATLTASGGTSYAWSNGAGTASTSVSPIVNTNYTVTVTNASGCSSTDVVSVSVLANPTVNAGTDQSKCIGQSATLTAAGAAGTAPYSYTWSTGAITQSVTLSPAMTTTYTVTVKDNNQCVGTDDVTVTINSLPVPQITGISPSYCKDGSPINLTGIPTDAGGSFTFPSSPAALSNNTNGTAILNPFTSGTNIGAGTFTVTYNYTDGFGCSASKSESIVIGNVNTPVVSITGIAAMYAENSATPETILGNPMPGALPTWGDMECATCGAGFVYNGNGIATITPTGFPGVGIYPVTYTYFNGSCENSNTANITIGLPVNIININPTYCKTAAAFLLENDNTVIGTSGTYYVYSGTSSVTGTLIYTLNDDGTASFDPSLNPLGDYTIKYVITKDAITNSDEISFEVIDIPVATFNLKSGATTWNNSDAGISFCENASVTLVGNPNTGGVFAGTGVSGLTLTPATIGAGNSATISYTYSANGCTVTEDADVTILALPSPQIFSAKTTFCNNDAAATITSTPIGGTWTRPAGWTADIIMKINADGSVTFTPQNVTTAATKALQYSYTDVNGCTASTTKNFTVNLITSLSISNLPVTYCQNAANLTINSNQTSGTFSGSGITNNGNGTALFSPTALPAGSHTISFSYVNGSGCISTTSQNITILKSPTIYAVTGGAPFCENLTGSLVGLSNAEVGTKYDLYRNATTLVTSTTAAATGAFNFGGLQTAGTYTVKATAANACTENMTGSVAVVKLPLPADANAITGTTSICVGGSGTYTIPAITNATGYTWTIPANASISSGSNTNSIVVSFPAGTASGTVSVLGTNSCGNGQAASIAVTVSQLPVATASITGSATVCQGQKAVIYDAAAIANATSYVWTVPNGATIVSGQGTKTIEVDYASNAINGSITVYGSNACGNGPVLSKAITVKAPPQNVTVTNMSTPSTIYCSGNSVQLQANTTTPGVAWAWTTPDGIISSGSNIQTITVTQGGTYNVTITEPVNLCKSVKSITVSENKTTPVASILPLAATDVITCTKTTVSVDGLGSSTLGAVGYSWSTVDGAIVGSTTNSNIDVSKGGTYTLTVTDATNFCTATASVLVNENKALPEVHVVSPNATKLSCLNASVSMSGASNDAGVAYLWTGPGAITNATTVAPSVSSAGTYTLQVTGANGCKSTASVLVEEDYSAPQGVSVSTPAKLTCAVTQINLQANCSTTGATFLWSASGGGSIAGREVAKSNPKIIVGGTYTVTVTHPTTGCTVTASTVVETDYIAPAVVFPSVPEILSCTQTTVNVSGGTTAVNPSYLWTTADGYIVSGSSTATISVSYSGTYSLKVTDNDNGCWSTNSIAVQKDASLPDVFINPYSEITCSNPVITISGSSATANVSALWTTTNGNFTSGTNPASFAVDIDKGGTYVLTVTNNVTGCTASKSAIVKLNMVYPLIVNFDDTPDMITCTKPSVQLSGNTTTTNATFLWTSVNPIINPTSTNPTVSDPGVYTLFVTAPNGCTRQKSVTVSEDKSTPAVPTILPPADLTCTKLTTQLTISPVDASATYTWSTSGTGTISDINSSNPTVDAIGVYSLVAKSKTTGCTSATSAVVNQNIALPDVSIPVSPLPITCSGTNVTISAQTFVASPTYLWSTTNGNIISSKTLKDITVDKTGTYTISVTNTVNGCTNTASTTVTENKVEADIVIGDPDPISCSQTTVQLSAYSVTPNTSALWTTTDGNILLGAGSFSPIVNKAGKYTITVTNNGNGCTSSKDVTVLADTASPVMTAFNSSPDNLTCTKTSVDISGSSSSPNASYLWTGVSSITNPTSSIASVSSPGVYNLLVTGENGCTKSMNVTVVEDKTVPTAPIIQFPAQLTCKVLQTALVVDPIDGGVTYKWTSSGLGTISTPDLSQTLVNMAGVYTVTAKSLANGCTSSTDVTVLENKALATTVIAPGPYVIDCSNSSVTLDGSASTGTNPVWSSATGGNILLGKNTKTPVVNAEGIYTLTTEHAVSGCTTTADISVTTGTDKPDVWVNAFPEKLTCSKLSVTLSGNTSVSQYSWSTTDGNIVSGGNSFTPVVDQPGTYTFTVENTLTSCISVASVVVEKDDAAPVVSVVSVPEKFTCSRLEVTLSATAGSPKNPDPVFAYTWSAGAGGLIKNNANTPSPTVLSVATYTVSVQDMENNCVSTATVKTTIDTVSPQITVNKTPAKLNCKDKTVILSGSSTTPNATFAWSTTGTGTIVNASTKTPIVNGAGEYILTVTDPKNACTASDNVFVLIDTLKPNIFVDKNADQLTCTVNSVTLSGSSSGNVAFLWSTSGSGTITGATSQNPSVNAIGYYRLKVTDNVNFCTASDSVEVTANKVAATPPVVVSAENCYNEPNELVSAIGTSIKWYKDANRSVFIKSGDTYLSTETAVGIYNYFATQTGANGCESQVSNAKLQIRALPSTPITEDKSSCLNSPVPSLFATGTSIKWYDAPDGTLLFTGATFPTGQTNTGQYQYYATQTDAYSCESNAKLVKLTIRALPDAPGIIIPEYSICYLDSNPEMAVTGSTINWKASPTAAANLATGNYYKSAEKNPGTYNYYVSQTDIYGCTGAFDSLTLTIKPRPLIYTIAGGGQYCEDKSGKEITLSGSESGVTYSLLFNSINTLTVRQGTGNSLSFGEYLLQGEYSISASTTESCTEQMNGKTIIGIDSLPYQASDISGERIVCENQKAVKFEVAPIKFATIYNWILPAGYQIVAGNDSRSIAIDISPTAESGTIYVYGSNSCGDGLQSAGFQIIVNKLPVPASPIIASTEFCQLDTMSFETDYITNALSYKWNLPLGAEVISGDSSRRILVKFGAGEVGGPVIVTGENQCGFGKSSDTLVVKAKPRPSVYAGQDLGLCSDFTNFGAILTAPSTGEWIVYNSPGIITNINSPTSKVSSLRKGENVFIWKVTENGCSSYDTVTLTNNQVFVDAGTNQTVCGEIAQFNAPLPPLGTGIWSVTYGSGSNIVTNDPTSTVTGLSKGTNIFKWTVTYNGCQSYDSVIIVNDQPSNANAGVDQVVAIAATQLGAEVPQIGTGTWSVEKGGGIFENQNLFNSFIYDLIFGENILVWTVKNNLCLSEDKVKIVNNSIPNLDAGVDQNLCVNYSVMDASNPYPAHGVWTVIKGSAKFTNNKLFNTEVTDIGHGENIFRWTITETGKYDSVVVVNNSTTVPFAGINKELCTDVTDLQANTALYGTGVWTVVGGGGSIDNRYDPKSTVRFLPQGKNTFKWTITLDRCISESVVEISNNTPTDAYAGEDQTICEKTVSLTPNTPDFGVGSWRIVSGTASIDKNAIASELSIEKNVLEWRITNGACYSSDTVVITNHRPSEPNAGVDRYLCQDFTNLAGNQLLIGTSKWEVLNGGSIISNISDPATGVTKLTYGRNDFRWLVTYKECSLFDDVTLNYDFLQADAGVDQVLCSDSLILNANNAKTGTGSWSLVGGSSAVFENRNLENSKVYNLQRGLNTLRWTISKNQCSSYDDVTVLNNLPTTPMAGPDKEICANSYLLDGNTPTIGSAKWEVQSGAGTFVDATNKNSLVINMGMGVNIYRWSIKNGTCTLSDEVTIINNLPSNVGAGDDIIACYDTVELYANPVTFGTGMWTVVSGSARFSNSNSNSSKVYNLNQGSNILLWTVSQGMCSVKDTLEIYNNVPTTPIAGPAQDICSYTANLAGNIPTWGQGTWSVVSGKGDFTDPNRYNSQVTNINNGTNVFRWTISTEYCSRYDDVVVENSMPVPAFAGLDFSVCGTEANLTGNVADNGQGIWAVLSGKANFSTPMSENTEVTNLGFGKNILRWTITNKQCYSYDDIVVTNNLTPWVDAGIDQEVYQSTVTLIGSNTLQAAEWKITQGSSVIMSPNSFQTEVTNLSEGINTYTWNITINGCTASDQVAVIYHATPTSSFDVDYTNGCEPFTIDFVNNSIGGTTYIWTFDDSTTSVQRNVTHTFQKAGKYNVELLTISADGVSDSYDTLITVHASPVAAFEVVPTTMYLPKEQIKCNNNSTGATQFVWDFGDGEASWEFAPYHQYTDTGYYAISLTAISPYNCVDSMRIDSAVNVVQTGKLVFPTGFTPKVSGPGDGHYDNEDGSNDVFHPTGDGVAIFEMEIYNKWGVLVFRTTDIDIGWDGYYDNRMMDEAAYVYYAKGKFNNGDKFSYIGSFALIHAKK